MNTLADHLDTYVATRRALDYQMGEAARLLRTSSARSNAVVGRRSSPTRCSLGRRCDLARATPGLPHGSRWSDASRCSRKAPPKGCSAPEARGSSPTCTRLRRPRRSWPRRAGSPGQSRLRPSRRRPGSSQLPGAAPERRGDSTAKTSRSRTGLLTVRASKLGKSPQLPLHESTAAALSRYARRRDRLRPKASTPSFFRSEKGGRLERSRSSVVFRRLCVAAGVAAPPTLRPPRLYDLRH